MVESTSPMVEVAKDRAKEEERERREKEEEEEKDRDLGREKGIKEGLLRREKEEGGVNL